MTPYQLVTNLRVVRNFLPDPVPAALIDQILEAGRWTGSSKNRQLWSVVVLSTQDGRHQLAEAGRYSDPVRNAPLALALVSLPDGHDFDIGRLAQNLMLSADALGISSCPITLHMEHRAAQVLGIPPDHRCRYVIAMGYADEAAEAAARAASPLSGRKPMSEFVQFDSFSVQQEPEPVL